MLHRRIIGAGSYEIKRCNEEKITNKLFNMPAAGAPIYTTTDYDSSKWQCSL